MQLAVVSAEKPAFRWGFLTLARHRFVAFGALEKMDLGMHQSSAGMLEQCGRKSWTKERGGLAAERAYCRPGWRAASARGAQLCLG